MADVECLVSAWGGREPPPTMWNTECARLEAQRHERVDARRRLLAPPPPRIATHRIVPARVAEAAQVLEEPAFRSTGSMPNPDGGSTPNAEESMKTAA
jgi:hypothetical protein